MKVIAGPMDEVETKVPWMEQAPAHWEFRRAKFLFRKMNRPVREDDEIVTAFRDGTVTLRSNRRTEGFTNAVQEIGYQGVRRGDLVIHAMDAFAGAVGVSDSDGKASPVYSVCVPFNEREVDVRFYAYAIRLMAKNGFISALAKGIRERSTEFRFNEFAKQWLPVPSIQEQVAIANFLDHHTTKLDELVEKKQRLIELLQEKRQALITQAVTKGLDPNVPMKDSRIPWLGEVPAHWEVTRLKFVACLIAGYAFKSDDYVENGIPVVRIGDIDSDGRVSLHDAKRLPEEYADMYRQFLVHSGDFLMAMTGATIGKVGRFHSEQALLNQRVCKFIPTKILPGFMWFVLNTYGFQEHMRLYGFGGAQPNIGEEEIMSFPLAVPSVDEQQRITDVLNKVTNQIEGLIGALHDSVSLLLEYRQALISAAVTGQIDVRQYEADEAEPVSS